MPIIRCPSCNDQVEIEDDWYGRRIACPSCDHTFTPRRSRSDDEDDRPGGSGGGAPRSRGSRDDRDDDRPRRSSYDRDDDRPRRSRSRYEPPPPKKGGNAVLWIVLAVVGVVVVLPCVGCIGFLIWGMNAKQSFDGPWADHSTGVNAEVTASFPKPPTPKFGIVPGSTGGAMTGYDNTGDGDSPLEAVFAVGSFDFPAGGGDPLATHFADIRQAVEGAFDVSPFLAADIDSDTRTTHSGFPAREAVYSKEDGRQTLRVIHVNNRPPGSPVRLVVVFVGGTNMKDEDKQKFLNSVRISGKAK